MIVVVGSGVSYSLYSYHLVIINTRQKKTLRWVLSQLNIPLDHSSGTVNMKN